MVRARKAPEKSVGSAGAVAMMTSGRMRRTRVRTVRVESSELTAWSSRREPSRPVCGRKATRWTVSPYAPRCTEPRRICAASSMSPPNE
jgi:hypothetical protein